MRSSSTPEAPAFTVHVSVSPQNETAEPAAPEPSLLEKLDAGLWEARNAVGCLREYAQLRALGHALNDVDDEDSFAHMEGACALIAARLDALLEAVDLPAHAAGAAHE